ncbi:hypothetical protein [Halorussus aquaticus]
MKRRQFGAALATAAFSLGGVVKTTRSASAQETEPLQIEDVTVSFGGVTSSVGSATFSFEDGTMQFQVSDWTMEGADKSLSIAQASVSAADVSAETYATIRGAMVESFSGRSLSPLLSTLAEVDVNPDASVEVVVESVETDGQLVADQIAATGTVGSVVPEGTRALLRDGATLEEVAALGTAEWSELTVQRGSTEFTATDVVMERQGTGVAISAPSGSASASGRTFEFSDMSLDLMPPETIPAAHVEFASQVRQLAADGNLSSSAVSSAAEDAGVTAENTSEAVRNARFELSFADVTEGGETVVSDFQTSGTLAELLQVLRQRTDSETGDGTEDQQLPMEAVVTNPGTDEPANYTFRVTGDLRNLEPDEDASAATEEITDLGEEGTRVEGTVGTGDDRFAFSGELVEEDVPDSIQIEVSER